MNLFIKTLTGSAIIIDIEPQQTIYDIKQKIYNKTKIEITNQRLISPNSKPFLPTTLFKK
jgi:hypothetical protein